MLPRRKPFIEGVKNLPATTGDVIFVNPDQAGANDDGLGTDPSLPFNTLEAAYAQAVTNTNAIIALSANSAHAVAAMLDVTKNRIHFESLGCRNRPGAIGMGARTRITMGVTTAVTDLGVMKNTGVGNTFTGLKFDSSNTLDESLYGIVEAGEYAIYDGCEIYKSTDLDETAAAEILNNGDSAQWLSCYIGSTANITAAAKIRANMLLTATISGKKCRDNYLYRCHFVGKAADTAQVKIYGANATDVERMFHAEKCKFFNNLLSAGTPAHAVGFAAAQTQGTVWLDNCGSADHTVMAEAAVGISVTGAVPGFATSGVDVTA
jgi:hypothetical protein